MKIISAKYIGNKSKVEWYLHLFLTWSFSCYILLNYCFALSMLQSNNPYFSKLKVYKNNKNAKQNSKRQHLHIFHTMQVYKEHEIKYKRPTMLHFLWSSGFSPLFLLSVAFDIASSSGVKTSLINPFSIFLSGLLADKQLFWRLNKLVLHTFKFSFYNESVLFLSSS